jgi:cob(I)alamin adenosyltransferase
MLSITTKTGDKGESGLANGQRAGKDHLIFEVVGTLDELNSWLGLVAVKMGVAFEDHKKYIYEIQDTLFYVGAEIAQSPKAKLAQTAVTKLENRSDALQKSMTKNWITKFLLPGGTELGAHLDIARTVCRRCERLMVTFSRQEKVSPAVLRYINRLSDYLYVLRCFVNLQEQYQEKKFESDQSYTSALRKKLK